MNGTEKICGFVEQTNGDCRINRGHMALYLALFHLWSRQDFKGPLRFYAAEVMPAAKISSTATYHRLIRELHDFGYIRYCPSFYKLRQSEAWII